ncbi:retron system putative HNH endonuclease [Endozoicomonas lisbonensis]|uniref:Uncharacterized protein (TIGR02646 family) n=1 Tax=Endozoicomonas lisbonensis TaxID=3120522 RepID=A0ABV2SNL6_9GAMM
MRKIVKGQEPKIFTSWKRTNKGKNYRDLSHDVRAAINEANIKEQKGICAYCCDQIDASNSMNEHVEARKLNPARQLDFNNMVASCTRPGQCDNAHGSQSLPLTPLMDECETEIRFYLSGRVKGLTERAEQSIKVLALDNRALKEKRRFQLEALLYEGGSNPDEIKLLDSELVEILVEDLQEPASNQLQPFSPVLVNVLKHNALSSV